MACLHFKMPDVLLTQTAWTGLVVATLLQLYLNCCSYFFAHVPCQNLLSVPGGGGGGEGYSLIWPIRGCAAGQGMVCGLSVLNRVCDFVRVCPKQGI